MVCYAQNVFINCRVPHNLPTERPDLYHLAKLRFLLPRIQNILVVPLVENFNDFNSFIEVVGMHRSPKYTTKNNNNKRNNKCCDENCKYFVPSANKLLLVSSKTFLMLP